MEPKFKDWVQPFTFTYPVQDIISNLLHFDKDFLIMDIECCFDMIFGAYENMLPSCCPIDIIESKELIVLIQELLGLAQLVTKLTEVYAV